MRFISKENIKNGMILASSIYDKDGKILLNSNVVLKPEYIRRLISMDIPGVYIYDKLSEDIKVYDIMNIKTISALFNTVKKRDYDSCMYLSAELVKDLMSNIDILPNMCSLALYDNSTFQHSINVALLAGKLGIELNLTEEQLNNVVAAALLHDIGKQTLDINILNKAGQLTPEEKKIVQEHPIKGYLLLKDSYNIPSIVKHAVLCHHENWDGSGYPDHKDYKTLRDIDLIIHLCDVYDALISKRSYKNPINPADALEFVLSQSSVMFKSSHTIAFKNCIFPYVVGTEIILSNNEKAIIKENFRGYPLRPDVILEQSVEVLNLREILNIVIIDQIM